jgi:transcriptional regulator with XRE-family HTH domain
MATTEELTQPTWTLGERLAKARDHAGISRPEMADRLGVSERTIRNYENESVTVNRLIALAYSAETGVGVEWLLGSNDPELRSRCFATEIDQLELFANTAAVAA